MLRRESNVRVSIVVPHLGDDVAFEDSLVSVLENRPADAEVCVVHDGKYSDPFDLGDEVRFVTAADQSLPQLISAAVEIVKGRFVHILGSGVRATEGWTNEALTMFELENVAMVAPLARVAIDAEICAAGWTRTTSDLCKPIASHRQQLGKRDAASIHGVCLAASFWRKNVLQDVSHALPTRDLHAAQFGWSQLACARQWRCALAEQSVVLATDSMLGFNRSVSRGISMRALDVKIREVAFSSAAMSVAMSAIANSIRPAAWSEVAGQSLALLTGSKATKLLRVNEVRSPQDDVTTIPMPYSMPAASMRQAA